MVTMVLLGEEKSPNFEQSIVLASAISLPEPGGVSNYVSAISKESFIKRVFTFNFKDPFRSLKQNKTFYLKRVYFKSTKLSFFIRIFLMSYFLRKYANFIYATDASISGLAAFLSRKPYVVRWVGDFSYESKHTKRIYAETLDDYLSRHRDWKYYLQRIVLRRAKRIIVPSSYLKDVLITYYSIDEKKIHVIPNFSSFSNKLEVIKRKTNPKALIFVGRLAALKQPHFMLLLYLKLRKKYPVYIIGSGPLYGILSNAISKFNLENVKLLGYKNKTEMIPYLNEALAVVIPSVYEGQSFTAIEMLHLGIPVIMRDIKANKELLGKNYKCFFKGMEECTSLIENQIYKKCSESFSFNLHTYTYESHIKLLKDVLFNES